MQSNLSKKKWCKENNINSSNYYRWHRRYLASIKEKSFVISQNEKPNFTEIQLPLEHKPIATNDINVVATLEASGVRVKIYSNANSSVINSICRELKQC